MNKGKIPTIKKKQTKPGKKNWKKIDISDLEQKQKKLNQEELLKKEFELMKDDQLFEVDIKPSKVSAGVGLLKKKKERPTPKKSIVEERTIARMNTNKQFVKEQPKLEDKIEDLWANERVDNGQTVRFPKKEITFPKIPLPHPGQSYNPSKEDLQNLLKKVVDLNKPLPEQPRAEIVEKEFDEDIESDEDIEEEVKISNNPPVDDSKRKTRKEKNSMRTKRQNQLKEQELIKKKQTKIELANAKSLKRIEKEKMNKLKEDQVKAKAEKQKLNQLEEKKKLGIVEDKTFLQDFHIKKDPLPLRKLKTESNSLSERFENILKRNIVGEVSAKTNKKNKKLNKIKFKDGFGGDYGFSLGDEDNKLKIFE